MYVSAVVVVVVVRQQTYFRERRTEQSCTTGICKNIVPFLSQSKQSQRLEFS